MRQDVPRDSVMPLNSAINLVISTHGITLQIGILSSALEHITPEQMFATDDPSEPQPGGISAVKALQKASAAGQQIYEITRDNMGSVLPNIRHDAATMSEIRAALNADKLVITHTDRVSVPGWTGAGYIILDQENGSGAFKISGGNNGAYLIVAGMVLISLAIFIGSFLLAGAPLGGAALVAFGATTVLAVLLFAGAMFITAGIALVSGDLRTCSNALTAAWSALAFLGTLVLPGVGSIAAVIGTSVIFNDLNGQVCR